MTPLTTLAAFTGGLAVVFVAAVGVGASVGPLGAGAAPRAGHVATSGSGGGGGGGALPRGLAVSQDGHTLALEPARLAAGRPGELAFRVIGPDGRSLTAYETEQDKELHLVVVRRDATGFQHLHPTRDATGRWSTRLTLARPGVHKVFADFVPAGADRPLTLATDLIVPGAASSAVLPAEERTATVDGYTVRLDGDLAAGTSSRLTLTVSKGGRPVRDLQPYLGAHGHLVALRAGDLAYLHVHAEAGVTGPALTFYADVPSAAAYRLFLDFRHGDAVHTAALGAVAQTAAPDPGSRYGVKDDHSDDGH